MAGRVVLFGATGYTGRRTAQAMVRRGLRPVLAGRDATRLAALAGQLGGLPTRVADANDPASVRALIGRGDVLVSTVGPFCRWGQAALHAATGAGAVYLDSTGEPPFIRQVFEQAGPLAERSGASLITAFGYDYVPGNLAAALALRRCAAVVHRVEVAYLVTGVGRAQALSRGSLASAVELLAEPGYHWRDGIRPVPVEARMRTLTLNGYRLLALAIGATEHYALPPLAAPHRLPEVDVYVGWPLARVPVPALLPALTAALLSRQPVRSLLRGAGRFALRWVAEEPDPAALARLHAGSVATTYDASGRQLARVRLQTGDPYRLSAQLLAWGAQRAAAHGVAGSGALGPVQAFGLDALRRGAEEAELRCWEAGE
jgi:short subunit dehydrogenase-like uncharacterized protein